MINKIIRFFWPYLSDEEAKKYSILSLTFFFTVGGYWLLKTLKDGVFFNVVGGMYQPKAKMFSVLVVSVSVIIYSKLVDLVERHKLFYILGTFFASFFCFMIIVIASAKYNFGLFSEQFIRGSVWALYFLAESYGSLMIALFWSFVASVSNAKSAKRGYAMIMAGAQLGSISGPFLSWHARSIGLPILFTVATMSIVCLMFMIKYFVRLFPRDQWLGTRKKKVPKKRLKTGFWEGAKLLLTKPYLFGIFLLVSFFEIVTTIVDYQMKMQAQALPEYSSTEALTSFMGIFGMWTNGLAFFVALLGTGYLIRRFGVRKCLLIFPSCLGIVILGLYIVILTGSVSPKTLLFITLAVVIVAKGLSYALNNPVKEMLYIPTSRDAKFKTKSWIDAFGARGSKATGSTFTNILKDCPQALLFYGTILSLGFIGIWLFVAVLVGQKWHRLTQDKKIVG